MLTGFGRLSLVERVARQLPGPAPVVELDVTSAERPGRAGGPGPRARRRDRRRAALDRVRTGVRARRRLPGDAVGRRRHRGARLDVLAASRWRGPRCRCCRSGAASIVGLTFDATVWPGRCTTGWAWRRRGWSRPPGTSPATWARRASGSTWSPPGRCGRWRPSRSRGSAGSRTPGRAGSARLGHHRPGAGRPHLPRAAVGLVPGDDRRDRPRRRRLPRHRRVDMTV